MMSRHRVSNADGGGSGGKECWDERDEVPIGSIKVENFQTLE